MVTGGCHCGQVRYQAVGEPEHSALCHCTDCRKSAGAPGVVWTLFPESAVTVTGEVVTYQSSQTGSRQFCGTCGTGLFYRNPTIFPDAVDIQADTMDNPDALPPQARIQVAEAPAWVGRFAELPQFERYPG